MDKKSIAEAIKKIKSETSKRKFNQSVDMIINLKDLNLKNPEDQVEFFTTVQNGLGLKRKICALVGPELKDEASKVCDTSIPQTDFGKFKKKEAKIP